MVNFYINISKIEYLVTFFGFSPREGEKERSEAQRKRGLRARKERGGKRGPPHLSKNINKGKAGLPSQATRGETLSGGAATAMHAKQRNGSEKPDNDKTLERPCTGRFLAPPLRTLDRTNI